LVDLFTAEILKVEVIVLGLSQHPSVTSLLEVTNGTFLSLKLLIQALDAVRI
jgi:hypothetical protein